VPRATSTRAEWNARMIQGVKNEAARRIDAQFPGWRQRRAMMDWLYLSEKRADGGTLTPAERARVATYRAMRAWIKARTDASDAIEARVVSMTDAEAGTFNPTTAPEWP